MDAKTKRLNAIITPIIAVVLAFAIGSIFILISGHNPIEGFLALLEVFSNMYNIGEWFSTASVLILTGTAVAFAFRTGMFNIGAEGQFMMGAVTGIAVGALPGIPWMIHLPLTIIAAGFAGALWAGIPGVLKAAFGVHEVVVCIMLNYIALFFSNFLVENWLKNPTATAQSVPIEPSASLSLGWLSDIFNGARVNLGIFIAIGAVVLFWFLIKKTTFGYQLRAVGLNQDAAKYAGISVNRNIVLSMMIAGTFAGLAGVIYSNGIFNYITSTSGFLNFGMDGIAVALLGNSTPFGTLLSALLFSFLQAGAKTMQVSAGIPAEIVSIITALIIFFVASSYAIQFVLRKLTEKKAKKGGAQNAV